MTGNQYGKCFNPKVGRNIPLRLQLRSDDFWNRVDVKKPSECWKYRGCKDSHGYGWLTFCNRQIRASRLAWMISNKLDVPQGKVVLHKCDNPPCCNPAHLYLGTQKDNVRDMLVRGRYPSVFTPAEVKDVFARTHRGETCASVAKFYGVSKSAIAAIKRGERWKHLTQE